MQRISHGFEQLDAGTWRFHHAPGGTIASYDFRLRPRDLTEFADRSHELSTSSDSTYVTTLIAARPMPEGTLLLLSRTLRWLGTSDPDVRTIAGLEEFAGILSERFLVPLGDLGPDGASRLWEKAGTQHERWRARSQTDPQPARRCVRHDRFHTGERRGGLPPERSRPAAHRLRWVIRRPCHRRHGRACCCIRRRRGAAG